MATERVYFDANIVLDIINNSREGHDEAKQLWKEMVIVDWKIVISEDILTNVYYITPPTKHPKLKQHKQS